MYISVKAYSTECLCSKKAIKLKASVEKVDNRGATASKKKNVER